MRAARIQIGRIRMKNGGADVRVLHPKTLTATQQHLKQTVNYILGIEPPVDAYAIVGLWVEPKSPGTPAYEANFYSSAPEIPVPLVVQMAGPYLTNEHAALMGKSQALAELGYVSKDWTPDST